jgi:hypothetical protein
MIKINKFQFFAALALVQLFASSGFTRERPDRFAQDLGGNSVCNPTNQADLHSRCPLRTTAAVVPRSNAPAPAAVSNSLGEEIPAPTSERAPSAISK